MTSWCRTSFASFSRYLDSLRCFFSSCGRAAGEFAKATMGMARSRITNRDRSSSLMISSWTDVLMIFDQLDSWCRAQGCLHPCRGEVLAYSRQGRQEIWDYSEERNFL